MPEIYSEETKAAARSLVETTPMTYLDIGKALGGIPGPTIGAWKRRYAWARPPDALHRKPIPKDKRRIGAMLRQTGVGHRKVALYLDCHPETARRLGQEAEDGPPPLPLAEIAPRAMAALEEALAEGVIPRAELLHCAALRFALAATQAIARGDLGAHRHAQAAARTYATVKALLPADAPDAGTSSHDPHAALAAPAAPDENALLEELARKLEAFAARGEGAGAPGDASAGAAGAAA